jgi:uncharacterized protein YbaR (Trm112 family)
MRPYESGLCTCLTWHKAIPYRIEGEPAAWSAEVASGESPKSIKTGGTLPRLMSAYGRWLRRHSDSRIGDIVRLLACPACRAPLAASPEGAALACDSCGRVYPVAEGIPRLTLEDAVNP